MPVNTDSLEAFSYPGALTDSATSLAQESNAVMCLIYFSGLPDSRDNASFTLFFMFTTKF